MISNAAENQSKLLDIINDLLKPQFKIEQNLIESDNEFSVDAPVEWNYEDFTGTTNKEFEQWVKKILKKHKLVIIYLDKSYQ